MTKAETEFKRWWLKNWSGWYETYEPRRGSGVGIPDVQVAVAGIIIPIEFKIGQTDGHGNLWIDEVRPDQIGWHKRANVAGIVTYFIIGERQDGVWFAYVVEGDKISLWRDGISSCFYKVARTPEEFKKMAV